MLLMPVADPLGVPEFGGTHAELAGIANYTRAIAELRGAARRTPNRPDLPNPAGQADAADEGGGADARREKPRARGRGAGRKNEGAA